MAKDFDFLFKLVLIGDSRVGKTCIMLKFSHDTFDSRFIPTVGKMQAM